MRVLLIMMILSFASTTMAADWYWRTPNTEDGCIEPGEICDGTSYATAWRLANIPQIRNGRVDFTQMSPGDTLYMCGEHGNYFSDRVLKVDQPDLTVSGACPQDPGHLSGTDIAKHILVLADRTTIKDLTVDQESAFPFAFKGIAINNANDVIIDNVLVRYGAIGIQCEFGAICHRVTVKNSIIEHTSSGVAIYYNAGNSDNWTVEDNVIRHGEKAWPGITDHEAISIQGGTGHRFIRNVIYDYEYGIAVFAASQRILKDLVIENNTIVSLHFGSQSGNWPSRGIQRIDQAESVVYADKHIIRNNFIADVDSFGIRWKCPDDAHCLVEGNTVLQTAGIELIGDIVTFNNKDIR